MDKVVTSIRPNGKITKEMLLELGNDPKLKDFQIICHWTTDDISYGWSSGLVNEDLIFGLAIMEDRVKRAVFGEPEDE